MIISLLDNEIDQLAPPVEIGSSMSMSAKGWRVLLRSSDDSPFLVCWELAEDRNGTIVMLTSAPHLDWTNLPVKPLMVLHAGDRPRRRRRGSWFLAASLGRRSSGLLPGIRETTGPGGRSVSIGSERTFVDPINRTGHWCL